jgi:hypothetical protein
MGKGVSRAHQQGQGMMGTLRFAHPTNWEVRTPLDSASSVLLSRWGDCRAARNHQEIPEDTRSGFETGQKTAKGG